MTPVPRMYMKKMAVGPVAKGRIDLRQGVTENLQAIAEAFGRQVGDITAVVLDRPRHDDLIAEIREAGARIKVIADGDITATDRRRHPRHQRPPGGRASAARSRASSRPRRCSAWAARSRASCGRCRAPRSGAPRRTASTTSSRIFGIDDLVRGDMMVVGTGISNGDLLRGVRYFAEGARTQSIVLCTRCNRVRFVDSIHLFSRDRHVEIRL